MDSQFQQIFHSAHARWPNVDISDTTFREFLKTRHLNSLEPLETDDLYLVCGCLKGDVAALQALDGEISKIIPVIRRVNDLDAFVDDVLQKLREKLLMAPSRLAEYQGKGTLLAWLRTIAARTALNEARPDLNRERASDDEMDELMAASRDPAIAVLKERFRKEIRKAFADAARSLTVRQRTILRLHSLEGLRLEKIATMYRVDKSTISRWLAKAELHLFHATHAALSGQVQLDTSGFASLMGDLKSELISMVSPALEKQLCNKSE